MDNNVSARELLYSRRKRMGLTQKEVAQEIGLSRNYYSQIEKGKRSPGKKLALKIAEYWGIDVKRIIE